MATPPIPCRQRGAALLATLGIVLAMTMIGVSSMRSALSDEQSARGERERAVALQAAEAALLDAERDIEGTFDPARAAMFLPGAAVHFPEGCGDGAANPALGLCAVAHGKSAPAWQRVELIQAGQSERRFVEFGQFTGASMPVGSGMAPARAPRYVIEQLPYVRAGASASRRVDLFYRITAIGFGSNVAHCVVLQTYYLKPGGDGENT